MMSTILVSCGTKKTYEFCQPLSNVVCIEIISTSEYRKASIETLTNADAIVTVPSDQFAEFFSAFHQIPCFTYFNDPAQMIIGDTVRITYQDGTVEYICQYSGMHLSPEGKCSYPPYYFSSEEFGDFINSTKDTCGI